MMNELIPTNDDWIIFSINVIGSILVLLALVGNIFVIIAHFKDPLQLFQTPSSQFILNIAIVDLMAAILTSVLVVNDFAFRNEILNKKVPVYFPMTLSFPLFFIQSLERFCCVAFPLWYRMKVTVRSCRLCLLGVWVVHGVYEVVRKLLLQYTSEKIMACVNLVYVLTFFILTQAFYLTTCVSLKKQNKKIIARQELNSKKKSTSPNNPSATTAIQVSTSNNLSATRAIQVRLLNEKRFLITIAIICIILALTTLPVIIYSKLLRLILPILYNYFTEKIMMLILKINIAVNPFIYLWRLKNYRKTFKVLYCKCLLQ